jgi:hypothetical protein
MRPSDFSTRPSSSFTWFILKASTACALLALVLPAISANAQTVFRSFTTTGEYTNNFNPWGDNGSGTNDGSYSFRESLVSGVAGGGGVTAF